MRREVQDRKVLGTKQGHELDSVMKVLFTQMCKKSVWCARQRQSLRKPVYHEDEVQISKY